MGFRRRDLQSDESARRRRGFPPVRGDRRGAELDGDEASQVRARHLLGAHCTGIEAVFASARSSVSLARRRRLVPSVRRSRSAPAWMPDSSRSESARVARIPTLAGGVMSFGRVLVVVIVCAAAAGSAFAQQNRIDTIAPVAPELADLRYIQHRRAQPAGHRQEPAGYPEYESGRRDRALRPHA